MTDRIGYLANQRARSARDGHYTCGRKRFDDAMTAAGRPPSLDAYLRLTRDEQKEWERLAFNDPPRPKRPVEPRWFPRPQRKPSP